MLAIELLGDLRSNAALPHFQTMLNHEDDFYLLREVLGALAKLGSPESRAILSEAASHESHLVREMAIRLMSRQA